MISFGILDDQPQPPHRSGPRNFYSLSGVTLMPTIMQPQPQVSNSQLLSDSTSQPMGFAVQCIPPKPTGFLNQPTGFSPQPTSAGQQQKITPYQEAQAKGIEYEIVRQANGLVKDLEASQAPVDTSKRSPSSRVLI